MFGENRLKTISYGAFIGFFIVQMSSETFMNGLSSKAGIKIEIAKFIFIGLICGALYLGALVAQKKANDKIRSIALGVLTALFIVSFGINLLPSSTQEALVTDFNLAAWIFNLRIYFMATLTIWLIVIQFIPNKREEDKKK